MCLSGQMRFIEGSHAFSLGTSWHERRDFSSTWFRIFTKGKNVVYMQKMTRVMKKMMKVITNPKSFLSISLRLHRFMKETNNDSIRKGLTVYALKFAIIKFLNSNLVF